MFVLLNILNLKGKLMPNTKKITFQNEFGQHVLGFFSIFFSLLVLLYISWFRVFKYQKFAINALVVIIYLVFQLASIGLGFYFFILADSKIRLILTSFCICPLIAISFSAFYGIWKSNDKSAYEYSFEKSRKFNVAQIQDFQRKGFCQ